MELVTLDPEAIVVDQNVRSKVGDLAALVESIRERGVLVPLLVERQNGHYRLVAGQRRRAAAIQAQVQVPCVVRDVSTDQGFIEAQLIENLGRQDLTAADTAAGFEQLAGFGLDDKAIAALTTSTVDDVKTGRTVAKSKVAQGLAKRHEELTLDQAAVIAEFEGDTDAVKTVLECAVKHPEDFAHVTAELRANRERREQVAKLRAEAEAKGLRVVDEMPPHPSKLSDLKRTTGTLLTPANHKKCPGNAVYLMDRTYAEPQLIPVCTDSKANSHVYRYGTAGSPAAKAAKATDEERAQRSEVIQFNKAWRTAEPVRLDFVRQLLARKTPPKGTLRFVVEEVVGDPERVGGGNDKVLAGLLGVKDPDAGKGIAPDGDFTYSRRVALPVARRAPDNRLPMVLLAQVAADRESSMDVHTWRQDPHPSGRPSAAARWLAFLASCGYTLSPVEKRVV